MTKFSLGRCFMSRGVADLIAKDGSFKAVVAHSIRRHESGDWGDVSAEDAKENELAIGRHLRIFSVYKLKSALTLWVITEADRSITTVLFPEEY